MKRGKKSPRRKLVAELDRVFSLYIRAKSKVCVFCGKPTEHWFHIITRAKYAVRWDESNAVPSCAGCNFRMEYDPHPFIKWYIDTYGLPAYEDLILRSNKIAKFSADDLQNMIDKYKGI